MQELKNGPLVKASRILILVLISIPLLGQEICNNARDDDGDGLIDLWDPECACGNNLIPNGDFESMLLEDSLAIYGYPGQFGQPSLFPKFWENVIGKPRYFTDHFCQDWCNQILSGQFGLFLSNTGGNFHEIVGTCLKQALLGEHNYKLQFNLGLACDFRRAAAGAICDGYQSVLYLYGKRDCEFISDTTFLDCQTESRVGLEMIDTIWLPRLELDASDNYIGKIEHEFKVPAGKNYQMLFLGFPCQTDFVYQGLYLDDLFLGMDTSSLDVVLHDTCTGNVLLQVSGFDSIPPPDISFQWYRNGIALVGETNYYLGLTPVFGPGTYMVVWTNQVGCAKAVYEYVPSMVNLEIQAESYRICQGDTIKLKVDSTYFISYMWNNGAQTPTLDITSPGNYEVEVTWQLDQEICKATLGLFIDPGETIPVQIVTIPGKNGLDGFIDVQTSLNLMGVYWDDGFPGLLRRTGLDTGTYCVTLERANFCRLDTCIRLVSLPDSLACTVEVVQPSCPQATDGRIILRPSGGIKPYWIVINGESYSGDSLDFNKLVAGEYVWKVTDMQGDSCTGSIVLEDIPMGWYTVATPVYCDDGKDGRIEVRPAINSGDMRVIWPDGQITMERSGLVPGSYPFTVQQGSCLQADTAIVDILGISRPLTVQTGLTGCDPTNAYIDFGFLDLPGDPSVGLLDDLAAGSGYFAGLQIDSIYGFWIRSPEGCLDTVWVPTLPYLPPQLVIQVLDSSANTFQLGLQLNFEPQTLNWLNATVPSQCTGCMTWTVVQGMKEQWIRVLAKDSIGCMVSDSIIIPSLPVDAIFLPNVFSPNGDQVNDTWEIHTNLTIPYHILIRDRWGVVLLDQKGKDLREISWNGKIADQEIRPGVYIMQLLLYPGENRQRLLSESITILR